MLDVVCEDADSIFFNDVFAFCTYETEDNNVFAYETGICDGVVDNSKLHGRMVVDMLLHTKFLERDGLNEVEHV